jgi:hypothetical protein
MSTRLGIYSIVFPINLNTLNIMFPFKLQLVEDIVLIVYQNCLNITIHFK